MPHSQETSARDCVSILFDGPAADLAVRSDELDYFVDLNLELVVEAITADREQYELSRSSTPR